MYRFGGDAFVELVYYGLIWNVFSFFLYVIDKHKARKNRYRVSESFLLSVAFLGGGLGALLAMYMVHHKTKKWMFKFGIPVLCLINVFCYYLAWVWIYR